MKEIRLDKYICDTFLYIRSDAKDIIKRKKIKVNDNIVTNADYKVKETDKVYFNDELIKYHEYVYIMINKPKGYVCATIDNVNKTVLELIDKYNTASLNIVGRLDIDTTGLLLITNDGALIHKLTSPKNECPKVYQVKCDEEFIKDDIVKLNNGVTIYLEKDEPYVCKSAILDINEIDKHIAYITITEGKFHQVKKMCKSLGKNVIDLKRIQINNLLLDESLEEGSYRLLTDDEIKLL